ncbi:MAG TPA: hypothetical protein VGX00_05950 [Thermoplasmata archaeon]|nr:hypothetical protein [Thermoplasmata archaeon]
MKPRFDRALPSPRVGLALGVLGIAIAEYAAWPSFSRGFDYAGVWSGIGNVLLVLLLSVLVGGVVRPLAARIAELPLRRIYRAGLTVGTVLGTLLWAWAGAMVSWASPIAGSGAGSIQTLPSLSVFGLLPTVEFQIAGGALVGFVSPMIVLYAVIAYLSAAGVTLVLRRPPLDPPPGLAITGRPWRHALPGLSAGLTALGLAVSCCSTPLLLGAALLAGGPSSWAASYGSVAGIANALLILSALLLSLIGIGLTSRFDGPEVVPSRAVASGESPT